MNKKLFPSLSFSFLAVLGLSLLCGSAQLTAEKRKRPSREFTVDVDIEKTEHELLSPLFHPEQKIQVPAIPVSIAATDETEAARKRRDILAKDLDQLIRPWQDSEANELIDFNFEEAELKTLLTYIEDRFHIKFILDDILNPMPQGGRNVSGIKISYKTNDPLTKKDAWSLFLKFLDMAGLAVVPGPAEKIYRIVTTDPKAPRNAYHEPIPTFIGVNPEFLPDDDSLIRYVYFVRNANQDTIKKLLDTFKSQASPELIPVPDVRGIIMTDKAFNIKTMLDIVAELDKASMPEGLSIIKLQHADATKVAAFYTALIKEEDQTQKDFAARVMGNRRPQTLNYFPVGVRVIPEPRTNTLIVLGPEDGLRKVEEFILRELDKQNTLQYRFTKVHQLKYVSSRAIATILNQAIQFNANPEAAKVGGVREGDKYFKPMSIVPEESGNRLVITGDYEDYLKLVEVIDRLDVEQPQVGLKILVVDFEKNDDRELGTQIRNKKPGINGLLGENINFQTSGLQGSPIVENTTGSGATRLLGDLVNLAVGGLAGSTYITMGSDTYGVWGMLRFLETYGRTTIVSNPFLVTTNNYAANVSVGSNRRVLDAISLDTSRIPSWITLDANLTVKITPRISYENYITLDVYVNDTEFSVTDPASTSGNRVVKELQTSITLANNETAVLGGLIKNDTTETELLGTPFARIPFVGWLLGKIKTQVKTTSSILIFITPEILPPSDRRVAREFTSERIADIGKTFHLTEHPYQRIDPIHNLFFGDSNTHSEIFDQYIAEEGKYTYKRQKKEIRSSSRTSHDKSLGDYL